MIIYMLLLLFLYIYRFFFKIYFYTESADSEMKDQLFVIFRHIFCVKSSVSSKAA